MSLLLYNVYELVGLYKSLTHCLCSLVISQTLACECTHELISVHDIGYPWVLIEWYVSKYIPASLCRVYPCFAGVISRFQTSMLVWWVHLNLEVLCHAMCHANCHTILSHFSNEQVYPMQLSKIENIRNWWLDYKLLPMLPIGWLSAYSQLDWLR